LEYNLEKDKTPVAEPKVEVFGLIDEDGPQERSL